MRTLVLAILITALVVPAGCGLPQAIGQAAGEGIREALGNSFNQGWRDVQRPGALVVAACTFGEMEGRWPETREELERGAALLPEISSVVEGSFDYVLLAQELDGTLRMWFRDADGVDRHLSIAPEPEGSLVTFD